MEKKPKQNPNLHKQKISDPEDRLNRANQVNSGLQPQNTELKKQAKRSQNIASKSLPANRTPQAKTNQTQGALMSKSRFSKLSNLQFYAIAGFVTLLIVSIFGLGSLFANRNNSQNIQKATNKPFPTVQTTSNPAATIPISSLPTNSPQQNSPIILSNSNTSEFIYNVTTSPQFGKDKKLDKIVNVLVSYAKKNNLPTNSLSITLIDLKDSKNNKKAEYQGDILRYPASVVKLFWMVALEAKIKQGQIPFGAVNHDLNIMMSKSDNDAASNVVDVITGTNFSDKTLDKQEFDVWKQRRQSLNDFFQKAGYTDINVSQKTFPLPLHNIKEPKGADAQIRGDNPNSPRRNQITTDQTARLMYEIAQGEAVAPEYQEVMLSLLRRDLGYWQSQPPNPEEFDPVRDLFGEKLPANQVEFYSKAGWTTTSRQEVAYIISRGGKVKYILAIFGDDKAYGDSKKAFPQMSRLVFDEMTK